MTTAISYGTACMETRLETENPILTMNSSTLQRRARLFLEHFPGETLFAVKANPAPEVIACLLAAGIRSFDVASLAEIELVHGLLPGAHLSFNHPVKSERAIARAFRDFDVRDFVVDSMEELEKLLRITSGDRSLTVQIRIAVPSGSRAYDFSSKFGATAECADEMLSRLSAARVKNACSGQ